MGFKETAIWRASSNWVIKIKIMREKGKRIQKEMGESKFNHDRCGGWKIDGSVVVNV